MTTAAPRHAGAGPRARRRRGVSTLLTAAALCATLAACTGSASHHASSARSSARSSADDSYGALPTFLPSGGDQADSIITGAPGRPAVTSQGDQVLAKVPGGAVQVSVVGPLVPGEGLPYVTSATTCTWTVSMAKATTAVPIRLSDFLTVDEDGHAYHPQFLPGEKTPPAVLHKGQSTSFKLRVVMPTGEGVIRWQPDGHLLALWDFVVEND